jgi:hypothetical protein
VQTISCYRLFWRNYVLLQEIYAHNLQWAPVCDDAPTGKYDAQE